MTHSRAIVGEQNPVGKAHVGEVHEELHSVGENPCQNRGRAPGRSGRGDVTTTSIPHPHTPLYGKQEEELGVKLSPRRMEWGKAFFLDLFLFLSVLLSQLVCNKLH